MTRVLVDFNKEDHHRLLKRKGFRSWARFILDTLDTIDLEEIKEEIKKNEEEEKEE